MLLGLGSDQSLQRMATLAMHTAARSAKALVPSQPAFVNRVKAPLLPPLTSTLIILRSRLKSSTATRGCSCRHCTVMILSLR